LKLPYDEQAAQKILQKIKETKGVKHAFLKTPAEGLQELQEQEGMKEVMQYLTQNPLPAVIEVIPALSLQSIPMTQLYKTLTNISGIESTQFDLRWIARLNALLRFASDLSYAFIFFLGFSVMLIVGNILKVSVQNRQEEIKVLKLIGASNTYIARPYLYIGIWYGLFGAVLTILFVNIFIISLTYALNELAIAYDINFALINLSIPQAYSLVFISIFLGWLGAKISIKFQLNHIDPV
jgi:cell division transport system permease protein